MPSADSLIGRETVAELITCLAGATPAPDTEALIRAEASLDGLGFAERVRLIRDTLLEDLPDRFVDTEAVIASALENPRFTGWMIWPVGEAVASRSLADGGGDSFEAGLDLLARLTPRLTAEAALRPMLEADLDTALSKAMTWTADPDEHVRRLASEGTRPFLPWAIRVRAIVERPAAAIPILDALYRDDSEYVRRSAANHLNDISRIDPALAVATVGRWLEEPDNNTPRTVRHAMRTLIKQAHPEALELFGFTPAKDVRVLGPVLTNAEVDRGGELSFEVELENSGGEPARLAVDYLVHYRKANGSLAPKVFKLRTLELAPGESIRIPHTRSFKPITTRTYHPGEHAIEVQVNGVRSGLTSFTLS